MYREGKLKSREILANADQSRKEDLCDLILCGLMDISYVVGVLIPMNEVSFLRGKKKEKRSGEKVGGWSSKLQGGVHCKDLKTKNLIRILAMRIN